jgi:hypothetical protein
MIYRSTVTIQGYVVDVLQQLMDEWGNIPSACIRQYITQFSQPQEELGSYAIVCALAKVSGPRLQRLVSQVG